MKLLIKTFITLLILINSTTISAQYYEKHYIAPAPWQYWSDANEIAIGTLSPTPIEVDLYRSDGTFIVTLNVSLDAPISYRFVGSTLQTQNSVNTLYDNRGLIVEADAPVLVNLRNIDSDSGANSSFYIKGNASLVSFGNEGKGNEFRLGYYRQSTVGLVNSNPVYSVMATEDDTTVEIPSTPPQTQTLDEGESFLFYADIGELLTADKPVVMNVGNWGDTPQTCGFNGQDGTFDQIAPVPVLGTQYLVVRGDGTAPTAFQETLFYGSEQTLIVATQPNTVINLVSYNADGTEVAGSTETINLAAAGDFYSFYHGDGQNPFSSTLIESSEAVIVYSGTAVDCETDISTVLPIGGCSGTTNIQTKKFINYNNNNLPYFGFVVIESATEEVFIGGNNLETLTGNPRVALGASGFYILTFDNNEINNPDDIIITSDLPLTSSLVQQGSGFSMSGFFSAFGQASPKPIIAQVNEDCTVSLIVENPDGIFEYEWFLDGVSLGTTEDNVWIATESGNYSVNVLKSCGWGIVSDVLSVTVEPCNDLSITKELLSQEFNIAVFEITVTNNDEIFTEPNAQVTDILPNGYTFDSATATQGSYNENTGIWTVGELAPGQSETLQITVKINEQGEYVNTAIVEGENIDNNLDNNIDDATITKGKLIFMKDALVDEVYQVGEVIEYSISLTNDGPLPIVDIQIFDNNADAGSLVPNFLDRLEPGETLYATAKHTVTRQDFINGEVVNQATITTPSVLNPEDMISDDPKTATLHDATIVPIIRTADLNANKDDGIIYYQPGQETTYVIDVTNNGPSDAVDVWVNDPLPEGADAMRWTSTQNTSGNGELNDIIPVLAVGEVVTYHVTVKIDDKQLGDFINIVNIEAETNEDPVLLCETCIDIDRQKVIIPKGISPNGDGLNDRLDLTPFHVAKISIFNRYGTEVFAQDFYTNEWEGQSSNGKLLPDGTYYYQIVIIGGFLHSGYIELTRETK